MFNQYILKIALISSSLITSVIATPLIANELAQDSDLVEQQTDEKH